ncbi:hypothetical protein [Sinomicrobium weinanense]|uniref:DUF4157 domain-containing protein n=1 Tax=Sinomicrobium weinanense TaxID=2842200 RepID=A0A926Q3T7_9FLAO|nr:hypothetical protein [Sinomicrobium weinanense]MBC9797917.1 hypothetical protein [Sinomicrobium weinanense]MBU3123196.1 hypothetical protein [Sinomicrobium weinanense]
MILISKYLFPKRYVGLTLWPVIFLKTPELKNDPVLLNHERIHLRQQLELLILPFYLIYGVEWLVGLVKYRNAYTAYKNISFEREAYANEDNHNYLKTRPPWRFLRYIFN